MKSWHIDRELEDTNGIVRDEDWIRGEKVYFMLNARHLLRVLAARPAYLASKPKLKYVAPGLRLVRVPKKQNEDAA